MSLEDGARLGPYRIIERIGRGGMATVYKAHHPALDRYVAIKVLPEFFAEDEEYRERFQEEARSVARLKHPNILNVFDFGQDGGVTYLVLELIEGGTLSDRMGGPMDLQDVVGEPIGPASDLYSLGIVVYEMLTGRVPFHADTPAAVLLSHLNKTMPPTPELAGELSRHAEEVLQTALAKAPADRFQRAGDFVAALPPLAECARRRRRSGQQGAYRGVSRRRRLRGQACGGRSERPEGN